MKDGVPKREDRAIQNSYRINRRHIAAGVVAAFSVLPFAGERADAQTWLYVGTDYGTGTNWSTLVTPGAGQTATFNQSLPNQPIVNGSFTIGTVDMTAGTLTLN